MPTFKLDGREIPFEKGDTIIRAAHRMGIDIPHYCWHPGLSVAANCRMCLVEIAPPPGQRPMQLDILEWDAEKHDYVVAKKPKLQPACQIAVAENMEVKSESSPEVEKARSQVQELLLLNHPVDCPICDQAGECRLQDYWLEHQGTKKRMRDEPVHKPKAVVFGPTIVYDAERCIVCTRCVRFSAEIAKDPVLDERQRGNLTEIVVSPGRLLDHDYTLMTEHVCPVGALTSSDFRFKARVWFLRSARTLCMGCATGCNAYLDYDPRTMTPHRHRPRENMAVNQYWMCDEGMLSYTRVTGDRLLEARIAGRPSTFEAALAEVKRLFAGVPKESIACVLSAQHSYESNFALVELASKFIGTTALFTSGKPKGKRDDILIHEDKNPNTLGVKKLAPSARPFDQLLEGLLTGTYTHVIALGTDLPGQPELLEAPLSRAAAIVTMASHDGPFVRRASVALPASTWAETEGTYINSRGMAQRSERAIDPKGESRPAWELVALVGRTLGYATEWKKLKAVRREMEPEASAPADRPVGA
ncbi:MAG TPA: 2Fe-2S iron-sulfur cluster-binding protein [Polyangiaceae bacterium]|nr:2Fe-2S iron-sulfur cluster-binding protein [Polyangiaceae bacterium]